MLVKMKSRRESEKDSTERDYWSRILTCLDFAKEILRSRVLQISLLLYAVIWHSDKLIYVVYIAVICAVLGLCVYAMYRKIKSHFDSKDCESKAKKEKLSSMLTTPIGSAVITSGPPFYHASGISSIYDDVLNSLSSNTPRMRNGNEDLLHSFPSLTPRMRSGRMIEPFIRRMIEPFIRRTRDF